jgi:hypothetical protein
MDDELLRFARLAVATARRIVPPRLSRHAGPMYYPASLFAALLLREHLRLTYHAAEDLLRLSGQLRRLFGFRIVPDHSTLWWFARRHRRPDVIAAALGETVARVAGRLGGPRLVALDSTGLWLLHARRYFEWRAKRERTQRGWLRTQRGWLKWRSRCGSSRSSCSPSGSDPARAVTSATWSSSRPRRTRSCRSSGSWPTPATTARRTTASAASTSASTA